MIDTRPQHCFQLLYERSGAIAVRDCPGSVDYASEEQSSLLSDKFYTRLDYYCMCDFLGIWRGVKSWIQPIPALSWTWGSS